MGDLGYRATICMAQSNGLVFVGGVIEWQYDPQEIEVVLRYALQIFNVRGGILFGL